MPTPQETAYPTLKAHISKETLKRIYSPSASEVAFVENCSRTPQYRACMLTLLKCAQRLGHFVFLSRIPRRIPKYIAECIGYPYTAKMLSRYDDARVRTAHIKKIRSYLNIKPADTNARSKGHVITREQPACLAPYRKSNINRFGAYFLDELRKSINIDYQLEVVSPCN